MAKAPQAANFDEFKTKIPDWIAEEEAKLQELDTQREAIMANLEWLRGSQPKPKRERKAPTGPRQPRGSVQASIIELLKENQDGLHRAAILQRMGATGDKSKESSLSNALNAMKKSNKLGYKQENGMGIYTLP